MGIIRLIISITMLISMLMMLTIMLQKALKETLKNHVFKNTKFLSFIIPCITTPAVVKHSLQKGHGHKEAQSLPGYPGDLKIPGAPPRDS